MHTAEKLHHWRWWRISSTPKIGVWSLMQNMEYACMGILPTDQTQGDNKILSGNNTKTFFD